jgi:hypothetical protein
VTAWSAAGPAAAARWSASLITSASAPRMADLNDALRNGGFKDFNDVIVPAVTATAGTAAPGWRKLQFGFGTGLGVAYEFDEDLRGGLRLGGSFARTADSVQVVGEGYGGPGTTTPYDMSINATLPVGTLTLFVERTIRMEATPGFLLFVSAQASVGTLLGATWSGSIRKAADPGDQATSLRATLSGSGWGGGGGGGAELALGSAMALLLEAGYEVFRIGDVESRGKFTFGSSSFALGASTFSSAAGLPIDLDYSGFFVRLGIRLNVSSQ